MGLIRILDDQVANQIAAGEVVERPSSVVKELVENAIDAGGTRIDVQIEEGGLQAIRVADNGSGIRPDDCETAFLRHATSKIRSGGDLFRIKSLGFRGEALPSIAAVSRVECVTSADESGLGRRLVLEGGKLLRHEETASSRGTDFQVRDLFYNTPARLKYLKTIQTELGHVSDYMYRLALGRPDIAFTLTHNGKTLLRTTGNGDLLQVVAAVYGTTTARSMLRVSNESVDYRLSGYISRPELTRANRNGISLIVNGRYIRNFVLANALLQAYHTLLPVHRYPLAVLSVEMEPGLIDVNVHPAKLEVRFSKEPELVRFVTESAREALERETLIPRGSAPASARPKPRQVHEQLNLFGGERSDASQARGGQPFAAEARAPYSSADPAAVRTWMAGLEPPPQRERAEGAPLSGEARPAPNAAPPGRSAGIGASAHAEPSGRSAGTEEHGEEPTLEPGRYAPQAGGESSANGDGFDPDAVPDAAAIGANGLQGAAGLERSAPPAASGSFGPDAAEDSSAAEASRLPKLYPIGQMRGTYIVAQNEDGLYLIDQHAAHERLNYEYYYEKFGRPEAASQELLLPFTLEFTSAEAVLLQERLAHFAQVGVYMEPFGGNTFKVTACPHWFPRGEEQEIIEEMAEWVLREKKPPELAKLREKSAILCSCKASIKANQPLGQAEMERLLDRLREARNPFTCPHGRPIIVSFSNYELEKMFKRVM